ncbi:MAG: hypothetical protein AB1461_13560 [Thermodesulfobacteriota bacterium]
MEIILSQVMTSRTWRTCRTNQRSCRQGQSGQRIGGGITICFLLHAILLFLLAPEPGKQKHDCPSISLTPHNQLQARVAIGLTNLFTIHVSIGKTIVKVFFCYGENIF